MVAVAGKSYLYFLCIHRSLIFLLDQVYQRSVDNLNNINEKWINDWTSSASKFQEMEVKRISYLRDTLWR